MLCVTFCRGLSMAFSIWKCFCCKGFFFLVFFLNGKYRLPVDYSMLLFFLKQYICFVHFNFCDFLMILAVFIELIVARKRHPIDFDHKLCSNGIHRTWEKVNILAQYKKLFIYFTAHMLYLYLMLFGL